MLVTIKKHETFQKLLSRDNYQDVANMLDENPHLANDFMDNFLPDLINNAMKTFATDSEKIVFLYSMIIAFGSVMINISGKYSDKKVYPMLFLAVMGPPASFKSVINYAPVILKKLHKRFLEESDYLIKVYISEHAKWKRLVRMDPNLLEPKKPPYGCLLISSDISKSKLIEQLYDNQFIPSFMSSDEIDVLVQTMRSEHGAGISAMLRTIFHADRISQQLKSNNVHYEILTPKLSVLLAGTDDQMQKLIGSIMNGLYSRFMILSLEGNVKWSDASPSENGQERNSIMENLADNTMDMFQYLATNSFEMLLTKSQWTILNGFGIQNLGLLSNLHNEQAASVVKRHAIMCFKIALTLTGLRYWNEKLTDEQIYCKDEDFLISIILMRISFKNAIMFFAKLKNGDRSLLVVKNLALLNALPVNFTRAEAMEAGKKLKLSIRIIDRILKNLTDGRQLNKISFGNYEKTSLANFGKLKEDIYD